MSKTIVVMYDDIAVARQVVEDLVNADFDRSSISLITNDAQNQYGHYLDEGYTAREDAVTAAEGAGFGAVVGGLTGVLVGVAALTIPGIGLAIAAGPVVAGLTGLLAGAVTGGVVGALVKSGVPEDEAPYYAEGIRRGGTLVSLDTADTLRANDIMNRYGPINIHERSNVWRQAGWQGFNAAAENGSKAKSNAEQLTSVTTDTTTTRVTHVRHGEKVEPFHPLLEEEPPISADDTAKFVVAAASADEVPGMETIYYDYEKAASLHEEDLDPVEAATLPIVPPFFPVSSVTEEEMRREYGRESSDVHPMNPRRFDE